MNRHDFWTEVFALSGSVTPYVARRVAFFGGVGAIVWLGASRLSVDTGLGVAPYEIVGAVLALLLVLRTNAGYDRWYEGRKLWGGIVNQSRNLAIIGLEYGPRDERWRDQFVRWTVAFSHVSRHSLRGERNLSDLQSLLGGRLADVAAAPHMPTFVAERLAKLLREARLGGGLDGYAFLQAEHERAQLIDHVGACERIQKTPLARVFSIKIRRFLFLYLAALPVGIVDKSGALTPLLTMLVAYPLLSLDQIGVELQNPFLRDRLGSLPLAEICQTIESNLLPRLQPAGPATADVPEPRNFDEAKDDYSSVIRRPEPALEGRPGAA
ncbi:MAG: bestrophin family protein [Planctomycetaceae bacterium]